MDAHAVAQHGDELAIEDVGEQLLEVVHVEVCGDRRRDCVEQLGSSAAVCRAASQVPHAIPRAWLECVDAQGEGVRALRLDA